MPSAIDLLAEASHCIGQRAADRDTPGERSMAKTVAAFNALTGRGLTEREGWVFMAILKLGRAQVGSGNRDHYVDGSAYLALAGECASMDSGHSDPRQGRMSSDG